MGEAGGEIELMGDDEPVRRAGLVEFLRGIKRSLVGAAVLLALDAGFFGSMLWSSLVCPVWFVVSVLRAAIHRPGWGLALARVGIPAVTLGLVWANDAYQLGVAEANARRIIAACEAYHAANGLFPEKLDELVPQYLESVPLAKYCLGSNRFYYYSATPLLWWQVVPPYYRKIYNFQTRSWSYLD